MNTSPALSCDRAFPNRPPQLYARPVIPALLAYICGLSIGDRFPDFNCLAYLVMALSVLRIGYCLLQRKGVGMAPLLLFAGLGYLALQPYIPSDDPDTQFAPANNNKKKKIVGIIDEAPYTKNNRLHFLLALEDPAAPSSRRPAFGKIRVTVNDPPPKLCRGDRIEYYGKIKVFRNFNNPGTFDYRKFMGRKGIYGSSYTNGKHLKIVTHGAAHDFLRRIDRYREAIAGFIEGNITDTDTQGVLKALVIGERSAIAPRIAEYFRRTGTSHLLAISGLHIGIIASAVFLITTWLATRFRSILLSGQTKSIAASMAILPVFFYGLVSGMSPSSQRAVIMVTVFLTGAIIKRHGDHLNTLAVAALIILCISPPALFSISFQLSFAAVGVIFFGMSIFPISVGSASAGYRRTLLWAASFFKVSLLATLGTLPLTLFYFNQTSLIGLPTNFLCIPLIGFCVVPLGLLSVLLFALKLPMAVCMVKLAGAILSACIGLLAYLSDLPFVAVRTVTPSLLEICIYYAFLGIAHQFMATTGIKLSKRFIIGLFSGLSVIMVIDVGYWIYERHFRDDLRITTLDVKQGNAAVLELPRGGCFVIDGGGFSDNSSFDVGARVVAPFLWRRKITTIDTIILSHANSDHLNGLIFLARYFHVKQVLTNGQSADTLGYKTFMQVIKQKAISHPDYAKLSKRQTQNGVAINLLYPPADFLGQKGRDLDLNYNSIAVKVQYGDFSMLFPGDGLKKGEAEMVATYAEQLKSKVLLAPHHGSRTSSSGLFLDTVDPQTVIISVGYQNRFHLPHASVLKKYATRGYTVLRTDRHGAVSIITDGDKTQIDTLQREP